ncbi:hypothetical protein M9980_01340 [Sphingomonas donggukensis]|uniref:ApeA N-terminal domain-containing protein n=1 Tax=Sphingomonas donggukensis TaxID=2949093 RepID=A0ABY4TU23_9SPHN|nr:HEPN domain-containing protein [Sphingomonas donggukensis]URW75905.1 hypothetical protein M9980_01340 [Sphingomonas donggukensis]
MSRDEEIVEGAKLGGRFDIGEARSVLGELSIRGTETMLYLHDADFFHVEDEHAECIRGTLHDRTKVTVLASAVRSSLGSATRYDESFSFAELMPAYIVSGNRHLSAEVAEITKVTFHIDDAEQVFYDFDAMGHVIDPRPLIEAVVAANERHIDRKIPTGPSPDIAYFAGRTELADVETAIGRVRVFHRPIPSHPLSTREVGMRNRTLVEICFVEPRLLAGTLDAVLSLLRFLGMLAGRPQNIDGIWLDTIGDDRAPPLDLYWTHPPRRPVAWEERSPHPSEILIPVVDEPEQFGTVLSRWLANDPVRLEARVRFASGFEQQRSFSIDRLVGAANMFDILPDDGFSTVAPLAADLLKAKALARGAFRALPNSPERSSVLNALGRLGRPTLRSKVHDRAALVSGALREPLVDLDLVTDEAVKCRNYYVHGSPGSFSYAENGDVVSFLTSALEFFFAASDLIDADWDIAAWRNRGSVLAHPFNRVLHDWDIYAAHIRALREGLPKKAEDEARATVAVCCA